MLRPLLSLLMLSLALILAAPLVLVAVASLYPPGSVPDAGQWWPEQTSLDSLRRAWELANFAQALSWSFAISLLGMILSVLLASSAALSIHLCHWRTRRLLITLLIVCASIPVTALWLPRFLIFRELGLYDSPIPLLSTALLGGSPLFVLLYLFSLSRIPIEQFEGALVEGAGFVSLWWQVGLPQLRGATLAVGFLSFASFWGNTLDPLIYMPTAAITTAPLALHGLEMMGRGEISVWMAGAVWLLLPIALLMVCLLPWLKSQESAE